MKKYACWLSYFWITEISPVNSNVDGRYLNFLTEHACEVLPTGSRNVEEKIQFMFIFCFPKNALKNKEKPGGEQSIDWQIPERRKESLSFSRYSHRLQGRGGSKIDIWTTPINVEQNEIKQREMVVTCCEQVEEKTVNSACWHLREDSKLYSQLNINDGYGFL